MSWSDQTISLTNSNVQCLVNRVNWTLGKTQKSVRVRWGRGQCHLWCDPSADVVLSWLRVANKLSFRFNRLTFCRQSLKQTFNQALNLSLDRQNWRSFVGKYRSSSELECKYCRSWPLVWLWRCLRWTSAETWKARQPLSASNRTTSDWWKTRCRSCRPIPFTTTSSSGTNHN